MTRSAECQCGGIRVLCEGEPMRVSVCHCLACQRRSGSAFAVQARYHRSQIRLIGQTREFVRTADSGNRVFQQFCPRCGTGVTYHLEDAPEIVAVAVGLFADPEFPRPGVSVYESRKYPWVTMTGSGIEHRGD